MKKGANFEMGIETALCSFGWQTLQEMKDKQTEFFAGDGSTRLKIVDANAREKTIHFISNTGKISWPLKFQKLEEIHNRLHTKDLALIPYEIDKLLPTWGNYIAGLFRYLGCDRLE
jgi:hypothetical protein